MVWFRWNWKIVDWISADKVGDWWVIWSANVTVPCLTPPKCQWSTNCHTILNAIDFFLLDLIVIYLRNFAMRVQFTICRTHFISDVECGTNSREIAFGDTEQRQRHQPETKRYISLSLSLSLVASRWMRLQIDWCWQSAFSSSLAIRFQLIGQHEPSTWTMRTRERERMRGRKFSRRKINTHFMFMEYEMDVRGRCAIITSAMTVVAVCTWVCTSAVDNKIFLLFNFISF